MPKDLQECFNDAGDRLKDEVVKQANECYKYLDSIIDSIIEGNKFIPFVNNLSRCVVEMEKLNDQINSYQHDRRKEMSNRELELSGRVIII